jgi:hypothetical protein
VSTALVAGVTVLMAIGAFALARLRDRRAVRRQRRRVERFGD